MHSGSLVAFEFTKLPECSRNVCFFFFFHLFIDSYFNELVDREQTENGSFS